MKSCPFRTTAVVHVIQGGVTSTERYNPCNQADCALWDPEKEQCGLLSLVQRRVKSPTVTVEPGFRLEDLPTLVQAAKAKEESGDET